MAEVKEEMAKEHADLIAEEQRLRDEAARLEKMLAELDMDDD